MTTTSAVSLDAYIAQHQAKSLLRFITCGSVDDGKSTLIGRLLYDTKMLFDDQLAALEKDSRRHGTQGDDLDMALLVDGLQAEREQGITIDVAYRFFSTDRRKFIVADTPGHEQYTRNMATGASTADLAVLLVDARKGILVQTRRHSHIAALMGIRHVVLAVNKMDAVDWRRDVFESIAEEYQDFAHSLGIQGVTCIPLSALKGDNIARRSDHMDWYRGPALLPFLETVQIDQGGLGRDFRLPVQWVNRPDMSFRGFCGTVSGGRVAVGDDVTVLPAGTPAKVARIVTFDGDLDGAVAGQAVTVVLDREVDASRGDVLVAGAPPQVSDQFAAHVVWMGEQPLLPGRSYLFRIGTAQVGGKVTRIKYQINVNSGEHMAANQLELNAVALCNIALDRPVVAEPYGENRSGGAFIIIDRLTNATLAAGMIQFSLRRASNVAWQPFEINKVTRAAMKGQKPVLLWFTGLSGAGKSTVANLVEQRLASMGRHTYVLDGDNVRHGLNRDLGFTDADRVENLRRIGEVAKLFLDAGLIVLACYISPFRRERQMLREMMGADEFVEIYVNASLDVCESRDPKGLYRKARKGQITHFTGIDSPYEVPHDPDLILDSATSSAEDLAQRVLAHMRAKEML